MDKIDTELLRLLQADTRLSNVELGQAVGLNSSSVFERLKKLEQKGLVRAYVALVDRARLGKPLTAFIRLSLQTNSSLGFDETYEQVHRFVGSVPDILECHSVAGEDSLILKVVAEDPKRLERLIAKIRSATGSPHSVTNIVLTTHKETVAVVPADAGREGRA
jgi:Lrp/AsnC family leucine-responsive transcriptional regulator